MEEDMKNIVEECQGKEEEEKNNVEEDLGLDQEEENNNNDETNLEKQARKRVNVKEESERFQGILAKASKYRQGNQERKGLQLPAMTGNGSITPGRMDSPDGTPRLNRHKMAAPLTNSREDLNDNRSTSGYLPSFGSETHKDPPIGLSTPRRSSKIILPPLEQKPSSKPSSNVKNVLYYSRSGKDIEDILLRGNLLPSEENTPKKGGSRSRPNNITMENAHERLLSPSPRIKRRNEGSRNDDS